MSWLGSNAAGAVAGTADDGRSGRNDRGSDRIPGQVFAEKREGHRQPNRRADLAEQGQVAGRGPQSFEGDVVLDDEREYRHGRADAKAGDQHPERQHQEAGVRAQVLEQIDADPHEDQTDREEDLVATASG